jgi:hypothetical protein
MAQTTETVPVLWLRADQGTITPTIWPDQSGNKRHATALAGEGPLETGTFNFNRAYVFDGVNDYLKVPYSLEGLSGMTLLAVFQSSDTTERGVWGTELALSRNTMLSTRRANGPDEMTDTYGKNEQLPILSTILQNWTESVPGSSDAYLALGSSGKTRTIQPFKGKVAEFIVFDRALGFMERLQVETYLAIKYGIPLQGKNYLSAKQEVLWPAETNKAFAYRITGLGRDDAFTLYQKQAQSAYDTTHFLTMSVGALAASNAENKSILQEGDFLLWGDNNLALTDKKGMGKDTLLSILERKWLMDVTGNTIHQLPCQLQVDFKQLPVDSLGYWLVIDRSGIGTFATDGLAYILPDSISADRIAYFRKLSWDPDQSGNDHFSFARAQHLFAAINRLTNPTCDNLVSGEASIDLIGGTAPFQHELTSSNGVFRRWKGTAHSLDRALRSLKPGTYTLKVTDAKNYSVERSFTLTLPDMIQVNLGEDVALAPGNEVVLEATLANPTSEPVSYRWENSYGFTSTQSKIVVKESGVYKVTVTNQKGCEFSDEIIVSGATAQRFQLTPSLVAAGERFSIGVSLPQAGNVSIKLYDPKGKLSGQFQGQNQSEYFFTGMMKSTGMYMVVLQTPSGIETKKLVVQ